VNSRNQTSTPGPIRTTAELARLVGLSRATVSRVLNGHKGIKQKNVDLVMEMVQRTGFTANPYSHILRGRRSGTIAVCLSDFKHYALVQKLAHVVRLLAEAGYTALIETVDNPDHVRSTRLATRMRAEAVVFAGQHSGAEVAAHIRSLSAAGIPHVFTDTCSDPAANVVTVDRVRALELAAGHLLDLGHRRIGIIGIVPGRTPVEDARLGGLRQAVTSRGLDPAGTLVSLPNGPTTASNLIYGREMATRFVSSGRMPTAFVTLNDEMAFGAIEGFRAAGIHVPQDVSVVGFNNEEIAVLTAPAITTIDAEVAASASAAVEFLLEQLRNRKLVTGYTRLLPPRLIVRESSGPARPATAP
jgi:DNA-binding LacI/PurR family transcriptional regulator